MDRMTVASEVVLTTEQQLGLRQAEERLIRDYIHRLVKVPHPTDTGFLSPAKLL